jgi:hypothetical protein
MQALFHNNSENFKKFLYCPQVVIAKGFKDETVRLKVEGN